MMGKGYFNFWFFGELRNFHHFWFHFMPPPIRQFCFKRKDPKKNKIVGFPPKSSHFNRDFHYKPSILGYPNFWKHPNGKFIAENCIPIASLEINGLPVIHRFGGKSGCQWWLGPFGVVDLERMLKTWMGFVTWYVMSCVYIYIWLCRYIYICLWIYELVMIGWYWIYLSICIYSFTYILYIQYSSIWHVSTHHLGKLLRLTANATATFGYKLHCQFTLADWDDFSPEGIHPGRLAWNLRMHPWKRKIIFQTIMFTFYVTLPGCSS